MTVAVSLLLFAVAVCWAAPRVLLLPWTRRRPALGIIAWQACVAAVLCSVLLLAATAAVPVDSVGLDMGHLLHACTVTVHRHYRISDDLVLRLTASLLASGTLLRLGWAGFRCMLAVRRRRKLQRQSLDLLTGAVGRDGVQVVDVQTLAAFCIPGGGGRIVVTSGACRVLSVAQLDAVIAHERAHLRGRHDLVLLAADIAHQALGWVPFFRTARAEMRDLVEMLADDAAIRQAGAASLEGALVHIGGGAAPDLSRPSAAVTDRLDRLRTPSRPGMFLRVAVLCASVFVVSLPWVIAVLPVWAARNGLCHAG